MLCMGRALHDEYTGSKRYCICAILLLVNIQPTEDLSGLKVSHDFGALEGDE